MTRYVWRRLRHVIIYKVLHANDTPHRIALGAAVGMFVAFSPLIGVHMVLAVLLAMLLRANRVSALLAAWVCNPATIIPMLTFNWMVGHAILPRSALSDGAQVRRLLREILGAADGFAALVRHIFSGDFWSAVLGLFIQLGAELWIGSVLTGGIAAVGTYLITHRAVVWRRHRRQARRQHLAQQVAPLRKDAARPIEPQPEVPEPGCEAPTAPPTELSEVAGSA